MIEPGHGIVEPARSEPCRPQTPVLVDDGVEVGGQAGAIGRRHRSQAAVAGQPQPGVTDREPEQGHRGPDLVEQQVGVGAPWPGAADPGHGVVEGGVDAVEVLIGEPPAHAGPDTPLGQQNREDERRHVRDLRGHQPGHASEADEGLAEGAGRIVEDVDVEHGGQPFEIQCGVGPGTPAEGGRRRQPRFAHDGLLVMTHLHSDHTGEIDALPEARIVVQRQELAYAAAPYFPETMYVREDIAKLIDPLFARVEPLDGDVELAPGVSVKHTGGHSPGHQQIEVELDSGLAIIAGDNAYLLDAFHEGVPPGYVTSIPDTMRAITDVQQRATHVLTMHDPGLLDRYAGGLR